MAARSRQPGAIRLRFSNVTGPGRVSVQRFAGTWPEPPRYVISTGGTFESVVVCLRYQDDGILATGEQALRVSQSGVLLAAPAGYPDITNNVVCGRTSTLGEFTLRHQ